MKPLRFSWHALRDRPWWLALIWLIPAWLLPVVPIDETRYLSIAWEMRLTGDPIGLLLNGQPYMDKSPLLFWLINAAWALFGVSTFAARLVGVLFATATVATVVAVGRRLGQRDPALAGWFMLPFVVFGAFAPVAMFDVVLLSFVALGMLGLVEWVQGRHRYGAAIFFAAAVLGLLAKGPVYLLHMLGPLVLIRWWHATPLARPWRLATGIGVCMVIACVPLTAWAVQSAARLHGVGILETLTHQSVGRVTQSFAHQRNVLWYLPWVIPFLLPWTLLLRWRRAPAVLRRTLATAGGRFGVAATLPAFLAFSLISGKQVHYLLPLVPGMALAFSSMHEQSVGVFSTRRAWVFLAAAAAAWAWLTANAVLGMRGNAHWHVAALLSAVLLLLGAWVVRRCSSRDDGEAVRAASFAALMALASAVLLVGVHMAARMDPRELARTIRDLQQRGVMVAAVDDEPGMVTYLARLPKPLPRIVNAVAWADAHPGGRALVHAARGAAPPFVVAPVTLADGWEGLVPASDLPGVHP
jgi:4-amino-4-deoxy-L-arabinose transferase-like glycosyltransferase